MQLPRKRALIQQAHIQLSVLRGIMGPLNKSAMLTGRRSEDSDGMGPVCAS